jgi:hypothetical protein
LNTTIIGIDCAAQPRDIGLALGYFDGQTTTIRHVISGCKIEDDVLNTAMDWIRSGGQILLAVDAPLGWPIALGSVLIKHMAGAPTDTKADAMFRRLTDRVVRREIGKQSLDVGADRIARTAHAALRLLDNLRRRTGQEIPLAWEPTTVSGICAIEVYPAATLRAHGLPNSSYKRKESNQARRHILAQLAKEGIQLSSDSRQTCEDCDDALDAAICLLAGIDFLKRQAIPPKDDQLETARKEGWIWVRDPALPSQKKPNKKSF